MGLFGKSFVLAYDQNAPGGVSTPTLSIQVGHPAPAGTRPIPAAIQWGPSITQHIASGNARTDLEERRSILFLFDASFLTDFAKLQAIVLEFLAGLESAGISAHGSRCHWCGQRDVPDCVFMEGRVTRICDNCIEFRRKRIAGEQHV